MAGRRPLIDQRSFDLQPTESNRGNALRRFERVLEIGRTRAEKARGVRPDGFTSQELDHDLPFSGFVVDVETAKLAQNPGWRIGIKRDRLRAMARRGIG